MKFIATWNYYSNFDIPDDVYEYLHETPYGDNTAGRWYIRYNTLHYLDKEMRECEIQGDEPDGDCKLPTTIEDEDGNVIYEDK
jgi:hypothetical protein